MKIEVNMTTDEHKLQVASWWATKPEFVLTALWAQLQNAKILWPEELGQYALVAQRIEQGSSKSEAAGSIPAEGAKPDDHQ